MRSRLAVVFICARAFSIHISYSPSSSFYSPYMPPLFPRLGVIRSHADAFNLRERLFSICHLIPLAFISFLLYASTFPSVRGYTLARCCFHLHACFSISHILFPLFLFFFPYVPPLFPWLGAIRSRAAVFDLRVCFSISHISLSLFFFFFPLYASTLPSVRGYTLARCCFSFARVRFPFLRYYSYSSSFSSPYMPPLFPRLGVIRSRTARFHLRACFFHFSYLTLPLLLFLPLYASTLPSVGGYTLARCCVSLFHLRACVFHSPDLILNLLLFSSPYMLPLFLRLGVIRSRPPIHSPFLQTGRKHAPNFGQTAPDRSPDARANERGMATSMRSFDFEKLEICFKMRSSFKDRQAGTVLGARVALLKLGFVREATHCCASTRSGSAQFLAPRAHAS